jgi:hypothetical protein
MAFSDSSQRGIDKGFAGLSPQVNLKTHNDHEDCETHDSGDEKVAKMRMSLLQFMGRLGCDLSQIEGIDYVPPKGRGLRERMGEHVSNRAECMEENGAGACLDKIRAMRKTRLPKRLAVCGPIPKDVRYDPKEGEKKDRGTDSSKTLWQLQEEIRELSLEGQPTNAALVVKSAIKSNPDWTVALIACLEHWTRGGRSIQFDSEAHDK